jgi:FKBP-type peptidyl-prolyl cis-trans isomerase FkpA
MSRALYLSVVLLSAAGLAACSNPVTPAPSAELTVADLRLGTGATATSGRVVTVDYTGWLHDASRPDLKGTQFDSSLTGDPYVFFLGVGAVIRGWDLGVPGMRVGGLRRLTIPPGLAYGSTGIGPIPPNATLVYDIELLDVQ